MEFNNTSTNLGLIQDCEDLTGLGNKNISGNSNRLKLFTRYVNEWYRRVDSWIWQSVGDWEFDDSNRTTLPIATTDLVDEQQDYEIPSTARKIDRMEVLDSSGNYQLVKPIDKSMIQDESMTEFLETPGMPEYYDTLGRSIMLYPKPNDGDVTLTNGLKLYYSRDIVQFSSSAATREPGFDNHFHPIISKGASFNWKSSKGLAGASDLKREIFGDTRVRGDEGLKGELKEFYASRHRGFKTKLRVSDENII